MKRLIVALFAVISLGVAIAMATNYTVTQGSGTTFGSLVVSAVNYAQQLVCDPTTPTQCVAVDSSGVLTVKQATAANLNATVVQATGSNLKTQANVVSGGIASGAVASGAIASGAVASGALASGSVASGAMVDLGAQADSACGTDNGTCSEIALVKRTNQNLTTLNTSVTSAVPTGTNVIGFTTNDPCTGATTKLNFPISQATSTQIIAGTSAKKTYVCSMFLIGADAENVSLIAGTGTVCATGTSAVIGGTTAATGPNLAANGGFTIGNGQAAIAIASAAAADNICLLQSGSGRVAGNLTYVQQ